jgi:hypothetical protein
MRKPISIRWWSVILVAITVQGSKPTVSSQVTADGKAPFSPTKVHLHVADSTRLEVRAYWGAITDSEFHFHRQWAELRELRPAQESVTYSGTDFRALLPRAPVAPGDMWELDGEALLRFLRQLHSGARLQLHLNNGDSRGGGYGSLRAYDERWVEILFRIHTEFALKEGVFTPGQFAGRLVLERMGGKVVFFRLYVPPSPVNVDIGWKRSVEVKRDGKRHRETHWAADAGSVSRLELVGGDTDVLRSLEGMPGKSIAEVNAAFARRFYRFKAINWVDFDQAVAAARRTGKPLHIIALNGTLDDESC